MNSPKLNKLLAIDTATPACSAALYHAGSISARFHAGHAKHTEVLLPMIDELLQQAQLSVKDLDGIIISAGPGAFTGLRVGASVAAGLAAAYGTPIGRLSSLALLAADAPQPTLAVLDARMNQCYGGLYHQGKCLLSDRLCHATALQQAADTICNDYRIIGTGAVYFGQDASQLPKAEDAFTQRENIHWQTAYEPIELNYLRDNIVQGTP